MDYPRTKLSCIQWEFEGDENVLFKEQFLNWDEAEVQVDIPIEPKTKKDQSMFFFSSSLFSSFVRFCAIPFFPLSLYLPSAAVTSLKRRYDTLVKQPDADFGKFPEIKIVQSKKKRTVRKPKIVPKEPAVRPPTPDKAKLIPELPLKVCTDYFIRYF